MFTSPQNIGCPAGPPTGPPTGDHSDQPLCSTPEHPPHTSTASDQVANVSGSQGADGLRSGCSDYLKRLSSKWVVPKEEFGGMHVSHDTDPPANSLQKHILQSCNKLLTKNSRNPKHPGQLQLGHSDFAGGVTKTGLQGIQVCGMNAPYQSSS